MVVSRNDLKSSHEEADINIVKQCMSCAVEKNRYIKIICEDTDVFVLLTAYILTYSIESLVFIEAFASNRSIVDINKTARRSAEIVLSLIAAHTLSGCDNVPKMFGIGKKKIVSILQQGFHLQKLVGIQSEKTSIIEECSKFVAACYGFKDESNLTKARFFLWVRRTMKNLTTTQRLPKLESLPPTTGVFQLNVLCAHFQACIWMNCLDENRHEMDPVKVSKTKNTIFI